MVVGVKLEDISPVASNSAIVVGDKLVGDTPADSKSAITLGLKLEDISPVASKSANASSITVSVPTNSSASPLATSNSVYSEADFASSNSLAKLSEVSSGEVLKLPSLSRKVSPVNNVLPAPFIIKSYNLLPGVNVAPAAVVPAVPPAAPNTVAPATPSIGSVPKYSVALLAKYVSIPSPTPSIPVFVTTAEEKPINFANLGLIELTTLFTPEAAAIFATAKSATAPTLPAANAYFSALSFKRSKA